MIILWKSEPTTKYSFSIETDLICQLSEKALPKWGCGGESMSWVKDDVGLGNGQWEKMWKAPGGCHGPCLQLPPHSRHDDIAWQLRSICSWMSAQKSMFHNSTPHEFMSLNQLEMDSMRETPLCQATWSLITVRHLGTIYLLQLHIFFIFKIRLCLP